MTPSTPIDDQLPEPEASPFIEQVPCTSAPQPETPRKPISSYAALVNPDEGEALSYMQAPLLNGKPCPRIEFEDVKPEIEHWQTAVFCRVLGANPPLEIIDRYVRKIWAHLEIDKVCLVKSGLFLVRFAQLEHQLEVVSKGVFYFAQKPFIVKPWNEDWELDTDDIDSLPIWIQLPGLDLKFWNKSCLSKITSCLGLPLKSDKYTRDRTMLRYARILVDIPLNSEFPEFIEFVNDKGVLERQAVMYEWKPIKCSGCQMYGHQLEHCKKRAPARKEWRVVQQPVKDQTTKTTPPNPDKDGFTPVPARHTAKTVPASTQQVTSSQNLYELIADAGDQQEQVHESSVSIQSYNGNL